MRVDKLAGQLSRRPLAKLAKTCIHTQICKWSPRQPTRHFAHCRQCRTHLPQSNADFYSAQIRENSFKLLTRFSSPIGFVGEGVKI